MEMCMNRQKYRIALQNDLCFMHKKNASPIKSLFRKTRNLCEKALFVRGLSGFSCNKKHGCLLIFRKKHGTIPVVKREVVRFQFNF